MWSWPSRRASAWASATAARASSLNRSNTKRHRRPPEPPPGDTELERRAGGPMTARSIFLALGVDGPRFCSSS
jgi:hypothetical protein